MKRSEMLKLINNHFWGDDVPKTNDANEILTIIEKTGMLPPVYSKEKEADVTDIWGNPIGVKTKVLSFLNEWEPE